MRMDWFRLPGVQLLALQCVLLQYLLAAGATRMQPLPALLRAPPSLADYSLTRLPGTISAEDAAELRSKPRAVVGYLSDKDWALKEMLCMMYASWAYISGPAFQQQGRKIDLIVFSDERFALPAGQVCEPLDIDAGKASKWQGVVKDKPQCFVVAYPPPAKTVWHGYPFINNVHFFADDTVASFLKSHYGYIMKTDFDAFLSPAFVNHFPSTFEAGYMEYMLVPSTAERLKAVSERLGLVHVGRHNVGPTWYSDASSLIAMANLSIPIMYDIYMKDFDHAPGGGLLQKWGQGEGWPEWSGGGIAMYATELAVNHIFLNFETIKKYDHHGDSEEELDNVVQIHCRHGDGDFNKFDFYKHGYAQVDLTSLDLGVVKDYAMWLAVRTLRQMTGQAGAGGAGQCPVGEVC